MSWKFQVPMAILLFKIYVVPTLEYGVGLWGAGDRLCQMRRVWEQEIESFFRQAARFILGVPIRSPTSGVYGDLGLLPFWTRAGWQAASLWARAIRAGPNLLIGKAMMVQRALFLLKMSCWLKSVHGSLCKYGLGKEVWSEWGDACM